MVARDDPVLCSLPLHASRKNSFGFPTSVSTSHICTNVAERKISVTRSSHARLVFAASIGASLPTSVTSDSIFQVLAPSVSCRKLSAVPWLQDSL